jgi:hypothetical protein
LNAPGAANRKAAQPSGGFASELWFRASSYSLKAPWRLLARLPDSEMSESLLMLDASVSHIVRWASRPWLSDLARGNQRILIFTSV